MSALAVDRRGATETLGFILAFALVTASIGIIYTAGFAGLQDARDAEQVENVERAFDVLGENLEDVRRYGTPSRSTEIKLLEGTLALGPQSRIVVNVSGASNPVATATMRPLTFAPEDSATTVTYEGGAVFRSDGSGTLLLSGPGWLAGPDRVTLPLVQAFRREGPNAIEGPGTSLVIGYSTNRSTRYRSSGEVDFTVRIESVRAAAWGRYLEAKGFTAVDGDASDGVVTYELQNRELAVVRAIIGLELSE